MKKTDDLLSTALGIEHEVKIILPNKTVENAPLSIIDNDNVVMHNTSNIDQEEDYVLARHTFRELIQTGNRAIESISDLANESESPRAYEVMATLMKTVADMTNDLYDLQKKTKDLHKQEVKPSRPQEEQHINVEQAVFVGSTAELLKQVKANQ